MGTLHDKVRESCQYLPEDFYPYGNTEREDTYIGDCSSGCIHAHWVGDDLDYLICGNPASHRYGLLTFEHQGCLKFETIEPGIVLVGHCRECGRGVVRVLGAEVSRGPILCRECRS